MEIWKDIPNYESFYQASNLGRIRSKDRYVKANIKYNEIVLKKGKILKQNKKRNGYLTVDLSKENVVKTISVHRIIAKVFLDDYSEKLQVNHKNGIKTDNRVINLEMVTHSENIKHAYKNKLLVNGNKKAIRCKQLNMTFSSSYEASEYLNKNKYKYSKSIEVMARKIRACCTGRQKTAYGYTWEDFNKNSND